MASSRKRVAPDLAGLLDAFLAARDVAGKRLCVGYSGGVDSTVLLYLLAGLRDALSFQLSAVHVHHGMQTDADAWADHCAGVCVGWHIPLAIERVCVTPTDKGIEAAARAVRQAAFQRQPADVLLLAQHQDDQAETVLFRLLRGAGSRGLSAMQAEGYLPEGLPIWRPLLGVARSELLALAAAERLAWIDDSSNVDNHYSRNFLRNEILPRLIDRFPATLRVLARTAGQFAEDAALLDVLADLDTQGAIDSDGRLLCARLSLLSSARARNVLRHWLAQSGLHLGHAQLDDVLRQALASPEAHPELRLAGRVLCRKRGWLMLL